MKRYEVFEHPTLGHEAVKRGWSWPAFFFSWIWACVKGLWGLGLLTIGTVILLMIATGLYVWGQLSWFVVLIICIAFGAIGNERRVDRLRRRG